MNSMLSFEEMARNLKNDIDDGKELNLVVS